MRRPSLLPLIDSASNLLISKGPYSNPNSVHFIKYRHETSSTQEPVVPFFISSPTSRSRPVGFLRQPILSALEDISDPNNPWQIHYSSHHRPWAVSFAPWVNNGGFPLRSFHMKTLVTHWRASGLFSSILRGWSNEEYPVYHPDQESRNTSSDTTAVAFAIERAALPLFGFPNYGSLLTAYFQSPQTGETRIWIPRRSRTKRTWPGCLDVTVGGGIGLNETASSTIVRESAEEASLDPNFVAKTIRSSGVVSFPNLSPAGWILPGLYFVFDLRLRDDGTPEPRVNKHDGEVEGFELLSVPEVLANLLDGRFKPSSALALVDFLIRHGHITPESEPRFVDVCSSLRRNLVLPVPWSVE